MFNESIVVFSGSHWYVFEWLRPAVLRISRFFKGVVGKETWVCYSGDVFLCL